MTEKRAKKILREINNELIKIWKSSYIRLHNRSEEKEISDEEIGYLIGVSVITEHILQKTIGGRIMDEFDAWAELYSYTPGETDGRERTD